MGDIGFGIIGCGMISQYHAQGIKDTEGARLVAVADSVEEKARERAEEFGVEWYTDYHDLLARPDIDVVNICIPSGLHCEPTVAAAQAGKHVICEKPLEITLEKCDRMIEACRKAGVKLQTIFQSRYLESTRKIKQAIEEGKFGKLVLGDMYCKWYRSQDYYDSGKWRGTWELDGGGALMNQSIHGVDLLQYLMGPVDSICAYCDTLARKIDVEDTAVAVLRFQSGALGVIEATTSVYPGLSRKLEIHGEKGTAMVEDQDIVKWEFEGEEDQVKPRDQAKVATGAGDPTAGMTATGHQVQIEEMVNAIRENRDPFITGEEGRKAVEIIHAIYQSSQTGKPVKLPLK